MAVNSLNRLSFFIIRADIKQYIGLPSVNAIFSIYHSCITELMRVTNLISTSYKKKFISDLRCLVSLKFVVEYHCWFFRQGSFLLYNRSLA